MGSPVEPRTWREARSRLNANRGALGRAAARHYGGLPRVDGTSLLTRPEWVPDEPIPLESVRLDWDPRPAPPSLPVPADGLPEGFSTYAEAMAALAPPKVFEDRPAYRLLGADLTGARPALSLGPARYFDGVNVGEAVAHELAAGTPGLPVRRRAGDPRDLARRTAVPAVTTVTVVMPPSGAGEYVLHWRDPEKVAHAGGLYQVMPVGVFQPLPGEAGERGPDLWRSMVREFAEELLGRDEEYGPGFDQEEWAFHRALGQARRDGRVRVFCLGLGVDPLTFAVDLLTVAVFGEAAFAALFGGLVEANAEGLVSRRPFDGTVPGPMQPAGAAALRLAWRHRPSLGPSRVTRGPVP